MWWSSPEQGSRLTQDVGSGDRARGICVERSVAAIGLLEPECLDLGFGERLEALEEALRQTCSLVRGELEGFGLQVRDGHIQPPWAKYSVLSQARVLKLWSTPPVKLTTIISGGQTGVDQAALLAAQACGLACGGWCPPGRASEEGVIPDRFPLKETPVERSPDAPEVPRSLRTEWNVRDSDATLVLRPGSAEPLDPGTEWAVRCAVRYGRPVLFCDPGDPEAFSTITSWLEALPIRTLGVGGPSEGTVPGIGALTYELLVRVFAAE